MLLIPIAGIDIVSWVHFGDLHITTAAEPNYQDFLAHIQEVNQHFGPGVSFAMLPGGNADDGTEEQYRIIRSAVERLAVPLYAIPGDHDRKSGSLETLPEVPGARTLTGISFGTLSFHSSEFSLRRRKR